MSAMHLRRRHRNHQLLTSPADSLASLVANRVGSQQSQEHQTCCIPPAMTLLRELQSFKPAVTFHVRQ